MVPAGQITNVTILVLLIALSWAIPRRLGLGGIVVAQCLVAAGFLVMGMIALVSGIWPDYEDCLVFLGLLAQAFLFNCLLLPLAGLAAWRHRISSLSA